MQEPVLSTNFDKSKPLKVVTKLVFGLELQWPCRFGKSLSYKQWFSLKKNQKWMTCIYINNLHDSTNQWCHAWTIQSERIAARLSTTWVSSLFAAHSAPKPSHQTTRMYLRCYQTSILCQCDNVLCCWNRNEKSNIYFFCKKKMRFIHLSIKHELLLTTTAIVFVCHALLHYTTMQQSNQTLFLLVTNKQPFCSTIKKKNNIFQTIMIIMYHATANECQSIIATSNWQCHSFIIDFIHSSHRFLLSFSNYNELNFKILKNYKKRYENEPHTITKQKNIILKIQIKK